MPLTIPNQFANAGTNTHTNLLDADFNAIATYLNLRLPVFGAVGARPAAGNAGAIYVASDQNYLVYIDDGVAWRIVGDLGTLAPNIVQFMSSSGYVLSLPVGDASIFEVGSCLRKQFSVSTEATCTNTATDLATLSPLSIPVGDGLIVSGRYRKTAGAAATASLGLKINGTQVIANGAVTSGTNQAEDGLFWLESPGIRAGITNYTHTGARMGYNYTPSAGGTATNAFLTQWNAAIPSAAFTSCAVTGITGSAAVTLAVKDVAAYRIWIGTG